MKLGNIAGALITTAAMGGAMAGEETGAAVRELAPGGKLRVAVAVSPAPSASFATKDPATGRPRGVAVDLGSGLANKLKLTLELVVYPSSGEITEAAASGAWDVAFMPVDAERSKQVDFGAAYSLVESTYLVPAGSAIRTLAEVDRPGVRAVGIANTTTARSAARSLKNTPLITVKSVDEMLELVKAGKADAVALSRESLANLAVKLAPGARILDGHFQATSVAIALPKGRPAALALASAYIEDAKAAGAVRRALDQAGLNNATVAPPAARP
jgi:polar amino acid transport system substrate-binding protein